MYKRFAKRQKGNNVDVWGHYRNRHIKNKTEACETNTCSGAIYHAYVGIINIYILKPYYPWFLKTHMCENYVFYVQHIDK